MLRSNERFDASSYRHASAAKFVVHTVQVVLNAATLAQLADEKKSDEYSKEMQTKMGSSLKYRHEDGMNFAHVLDDLIVGSCLQSPQDLDRCRHSVLQARWRCMHLFCMLPRQDTQ